MDFIYTKRVKNFTTLQEILNIIICEYLFTIYLACEYMHHRTMNIYNVHFSFFLMQKHNRHKPLKDVFLRKLKQNSAQTCKDGNFKNLRERK